MHILAERNPIVLNQGRMLYDRSFTLPYDGIGWLHFEFFEQDIERVDAMIVLDYSARAGHLVSDGNLYDKGHTLNLFSLSSLKMKEVGPVS